MTSFVAAYALVWVAVVTYLAWLGGQQRRLGRQLEDLEQAAGAAGLCPKAESKAA
jgi:CcmD family protein